MIAWLRLVPAWLGLPVLGALALLVIWWATRYTR